MEIVATKKKDGLIIYFDKDNAKYLFNKIECVEKYDSFGIALSQIFHNNPKCRLLKKWERKIYDVDPWGRKVDFGAKVEREVWDLSELFSSYGVNAIDNSDYYSIKEFMSNM